MHLHCRTKKKVENNPAHLKSITEVLKVNYLIILLCEFFELCMNCVYQSTGFSLQPGEFLIELKICESYSDCH